MTVRRYNDVTGLIGNTPLVRLNRLSPQRGATIYAKVEYANPGGSVKDRICLNMINEAERADSTKPGAQSLSRRAAIPVSAWLSSRQCGDTN